VNFFGVAVMAALALGVSLAVLLSGVAGFGSGWLLLPGLPFDLASLERLARLSFELGSL
jgi:hypothetical protein